MKCIQNTTTKQVSRVKDKIAHHEVLVSQTHTYISKSKYKELLALRKEKI